MDNQTNFKQEDLSKMENFNLIYSGPSFENGIKIGDFIENLKSIRELINNIVDVSLEHKIGYNNSKNIKEIKVSPSEGSLIEQIIVSFQNPEVRGLVLNFLICLFFYLLSKKDSSKSEKRINDRLEEIEDLISRGQLKNVKKLYDPLAKEKDILKITENNLVRLEINFSQKEDISEAIKQAEEEIKFEEILEEHEGYISAVDVDNKKLRFHRKGDGQSYPLESLLPLGIITSLLAKPLKANLKIKKYRNQIRKFEILDYKVLQTELSEFEK